LLEQLLNRQTCLCGIVMQLATLLAGHPERHVSFPSHAAMNWWHDYSVAARASGVPNGRLIGVSRVAQAAL